MKKGFRHWRQKVKKKLQNLKNTPVFVIVSIGLLSIGCCSPKPIAQPTVRIVETHKIDTCFVANTDTCFVIETDTLRVETIIRDTLVFQKIETKPIIVRDTITQAVQKTDKAVQETDKKTSSFARDFFVVLLSICISSWLYFLSRRLLK